MMRSLILLIYCTGRATAVVSGDIVDYCDYSASPTPQTRCGDICIATNKRCICGGEILTTYSGPKDCCVEDSPSQCYKDKISFGKCPKGRVLNKTETCNNHCYNDYYASEKIGKHSQFRCGNNSCVPVWKMCRGYSMCEDRSDVRACNETLTCVPYRGKDTDRRQLEAGLSNNHFYCNYEEVRNNGEYNTITRLDETNLDIGSQKVRIDFTSITPCWYKVVKPGLMCGKKCVKIHHWCREDKSDSCDVPGGNFTTNNRALCGNTTFWINKTCDKFYGKGDNLGSGRKAALGLRCTGEAQQCAYPWYLSGFFLYYGVSE